ncbi:alpha/beta hydrolase fold domain-containing protein [Streptomyces xanthophaeus]|uniref:alpha/beta hydrolase fold domain-containing protein n=1 Tax=Streptomyces xanthophaeus TaxID=67385 RepID=UPI0037193CBD
MTGRTGRRDPADPPGPADRPGPADPPGPTGLPGPADGPGPTGRRGPVDPLGPADGPGRTGRRGPVDPPGLADGPGLTGRRGPVDPLGPADQPGPADPPGPTGLLGPADGPGPTGRRGPADPLGLADRLDPAARPFADALAAAFPDLGGAVTDAAEARRILAAASAQAPPAPPPVVGSVEDREIPGPDGAPPLAVRVYYPDPGQWPGPRPTVVFCHGGGWVLCGLDSHDATVRAICRASGAVCVSVDYRRAPEARFPAAALDAYAALRWAGAHLDELGGAPGALVVAGDSAGANLCVASLLLARERGGPAVALQVLVYPALDAAQDSPSYRSNAHGYFLTAAHLRWFWEQYLGPADPADPLASPLRADPAGLPPAHVVVAGCDPLHDDGVAYHRLLAGSGIPAALDRRPGMFHGFLALSEVLPEAREAMERLSGVIASTLKDGKNFGEPGGDAG